MFRDTAQRRAIVEVIKSLGHATVPDIAEKLEENGENIALSTIYRSLESLEKQRIVRRISYKYGTDVFEDYEQETHDHFVCNHCHKIVDVSKNDELKKEKLDDSGNLIQSSITIYYGICKDCLKKR